MKVGLAGPGAEPVGTTVGSTGAGAGAVVLWKTGAVGTGSSLEIECQQNSMFSGSRNRDHVPGAAVDDWGNVHWLGDGAWAVGDCQGGWLLKVSIADLVMLLFCCNCDIARFGPLRFRDRKALKSGSIVAHSSS